MDGGAIVIPVVHQVIPVSLETMRLNVERRGAARADHQGQPARRPVGRVLHQGAGQRRRHPPGRPLARRPQRAAGRGERAGAGEARQRPAHGRRDEGPGRAARQARRVRQRRAGDRHARPGQQRPDAGIGDDLRARPDRPDAAPGAQRLRRPGPAQDRRDHAAGEGRAQRDRAGGRAAGRRRRTSRPARRCWTWSATRPSSRPSSG